ncbi:hypothetical protein COJ45_27845 [Bacillus cereus]|nr:hypothetical protein COJ45_27845 [Bacillus cereus]
MSEQERKVENLIYEKLKKERSVFILDRTLPSHEEQNSHTLLFDKHLKANFEHQLKDLSIPNTDSNSFKHPSNNFDDANIYEDFNLQNLRLNKLNVLLNPPIYDLNINVNSGSRIIGPPYDKTHSIGNGMTFGSQYTGKILTFSTQGRSVAALGFYITSPDSLLAAITPQGFYEWSWFASSLDQEFVFTTGGVGVNVFLGDGEKLIHEQEATLWHFSGNVNQILIGDTGKGKIANASSPAFGLGSIPIAPIYINMEPSRRYLVWIYSWQFNEFRGKKEFFAGMTMDMPFLTVDAGPPIKLH